MNLTRSIPVRAGLWLLPLLLAACATRTPPPVLTVVPPAASTATPQLPIATPSAVAVGALPAPLYIIEAVSRQVFALAPDGGQRQITFEAQGVLEIDSAPTGALVYVAGAPQGERQLLILDGSGRRELLTGAVSRPRISPDGQTIMFRLDDPPPGLIVGQEKSPPGVWSTTPVGGRPGLVRGDDLADPNADPTDAPSWSYLPIGWSPDGERLALYTFNQTGPAIPGGTVLIIDRAGGEVRGPSCCQEERWSADGTHLLVGGGGPGPDVRYGLFRIDAATGAEQTLLAHNGTGQIPLVDAPQQLADGQVYAFVELAEPASFSWEHPFRAAMVRVQPDGSLTTLQQAAPAPADVLWDPQARGAVIVDGSVDRGDTVATGQIRWLAAAESPAVDLRLRGSQPRWVQGPLTAGDCMSYTPLAAQSGGAAPADPAIRDAQARLEAAGFSPGPGDGIYGAATSAAVQAFQSARGLPASGTIDCATWQALLDAPARP